MSNDYVSYVKEATFGLKPTLSNVESASVLSEALRPSRAFETDMGTFYPNVRDPVSGRFSTSGSIRWQLGPENGIGKALQSMLGPDVSVDVGAGGGGISHTWSDNPTGGIPSSLSTMSILTTRAYQLAQWDYLGQACSRIRLEAVPNQTVRAEAEWMGDFETINASPDAPTIPTQQPFAAHETDWKIGASPTSEPRVEGWSVEVSREVEIPPSISAIRSGGTGSVRRVYGGGVTVTGRADIDFDTLLYYKRFYGGDSDVTPADRVTARNVQIDIVSPDLTEAGQNYQLLVKLPKIVFENVEANQSGRDRIVGGFPFKAYFDTTAGYSVQFVLINTRSLTFYQ